MANETFISYSRRDSAFIERLFQALKENGIDTWLDKEDIPKASHWKQEILVGIQFCQNFVYCISPDAIASEYCDMELDHALALNKRIIPIVAREPVTGVRLAVTELNYIFFNDFEQGLNNLLELLDSPLGTTFGDRLDSQIRVVDRLGCRTFPLYRNQYYIGRNPKGSFSAAGLFYIGDESVSRHHATLLRKDGRWCVIDGQITFNAQGKPAEYRKSANGVFIERMSGGRLASKDKLRPLQFRPLIHEDIVRLSPETSFIYEEIFPDHEYRRIEADDRETFTGG
ncbi:MAG TPA: TIR domain-containing protein [Cyanophyceae cyanobacterium]